MLAIVAAMLCALGASADDYTFSIPDVSGHPGQLVTVPVSLQGDNVRAFLLHLNCPESIEIVRAEKRTGSLAVQGFPVMSRLIMV